jgi:hypothetical protein
MPQGHLNERERPGPGRNEPSPSRQGPSELTGYLLQKLVKKHWAGKVRIDAALALPETSTAVDALITIIEDHHEEETIRFDAGVKAKKKHEKKGRQALREFANDSKTSETTRKKVRRYLNE